MADHRDLWLKILQHTALEVPYSSLITWFRNSAILSVEEKIIVVGTPMPIACNWLQTHYKDVVLSCIQKELPHILSVEYRVDNSLHDNDGRTINLLDHFSLKKKQRKLPRKQEVKIVEGITSKILNPKYTFENFIVGNNNRLVHAACMAVSAHPGSNYNPLFIYGGVGLGKSHLLQAVGNDILKHFPNYYVAYVTAEDFTNEVVDAIRRQDTRRLRERYRKLDLFIIDDIQFIANKDRTQEEFFHTFNTLYESGKQVIISSDRPPAELDILEPRLRSRFGMGMIADVASPDYETRLAILQHKTMACDVLLSQAVLEFIAYNVKDNIRELEGVLMQTIAQYDLEKITPTIRSVSDILKKMKKETKLIGFEERDKQSFAKTFDELVDIVCDHFQIPRHEVIGHSRLREYLVPRQIAMYIGKRKMNMSVTKIGEIFDGRDHTSVLHALKKMEQELKNDQQLVRHVNAIKEAAGFM